MDHDKRKLTRAVKVGGVPIGGRSPVVIQSMTNTHTEDVAATRSQIEELAAAGCELVRLAVPDYQAAEAFKALAKVSPVPLIADIHFDYQLACLALENGAAKIRINPGNIGGLTKLAVVVERAKHFQVPIRIGVNAGSLEKKLLHKYGGVTAEALVESALVYRQALAEMDYDQVVVSLKASDVHTTIKAYRLFAERNDTALHLGVTAAGPYESGVIKGAIGIGALLADGIGDTFRVSLTALPHEEVRVAKTIMQSLGLRSFNPEIISCPTCGRCTVDLIDLVARVEELLKSIDIPIKVAVMGCLVNGPGEAKEADIGISAGKYRGIVFKKGKVIKTVNLDSLLDTLQEELKKIRV